MIYMASRARVTLKRKCSPFSPSYLAVIFYRYIGTLCVDEARYESLDCTA